MSNSNAARILYNQTFDGKGFTNENSLANALLTTPDTIDPVITHLLGKESDRFPLSFMSEGQQGEGGMAGTVALNDNQFKYPVVGRMIKPDYVVSSPYGATDKPGIGHSLVLITFRSNWLKVQHTIESPSGTQLRVEHRPTLNSAGGYDYQLRLMGGNPLATVPLADLTAGTKWAMVGGANVAQSLSMGNESNVVAPGWVKGQCSVLRKSYRIAGNISNKVVVCQLPQIGGGTQNLWMPYEQWQHMLAWKESIEEHSWYARYNRQADGSIALKDPDSGLPIPVMAGVLDQIPNEDTYSFLTAKKIKSTVRDVMYGATDSGKMHVMLYGGTGFLEEFDTAMKQEASGFTQIIGDKFISGVGSNLQLGGYFTSYQHIDGHVITVKKLPLLDQGGRAEVAEKHPVTGLPMSSYDGYFIDQSVYDGKRNLYTAHEKGRSMVTGIRQGMSAAPMNWGGNNKNINLATEQDETSIHFMASKAVVLRRNTHCFKLTCNLS